MCTLCTLYYAYTDCILAFHFLRPSFVAPANLAYTQTHTHTHMNTFVFPRVHSASKYWTGISVTGCYEREISWVCYRYVSLVFRGDYVYSFLRAFYRNFSDSCERSLTFLFLFFVISLQRFGKIWQELYFRVCSNLQLWIYYL